MLDDGKNIDRVLNDLICHLCLSNRHNGILKDASFLACLDRNILIIKTKACTNKHSKIEDVTVIIFAWLDILITKTITS